MARDLRPFQMVEDNEFKIMIRECAPMYGDVGRKSMLNYLKQEEVKINKYIQAEFANMPVIAGTTEVWTDERSASYLSLMVHYIGYY